MESIKTLYLKNVVSLIGFDIPLHWNQRWMFSLLRKVENQEACLKMGKSEYIRINSYTGSREK